MKRRINYWLLVAVAGIFFGINGMAQENQVATPTQQSSSSAWDTFKNNASANYVFWISGPTMGAIDGVENEGHNITLNQFAIAGYKLSNKWKASFTQYFTNSVRSDSKGKPNLRFFDPYVTFSNRSLTKSEKYNTNLSFYVRYYLPFSHESADNVGKARDQKYGKIRVNLTPSKKFLDGTLTVSAATHFYKPLAGARANASTTEQRDLYVWFYPSVRYELSKNFQPYVAYSNIFEHFRNVKFRNDESRWAQWNEKESFELGFNWQPTASLDINPYFEASGPKWQLKDANIGVAFAYSFL